MGRKRKLGFIEVGGHRHHVDLVWKNVVRVRSDRDEPFNTIEDDSIALVATELGKVAADPLDILIAREEGAGEEEGHAGSDVYHGKLSGFDSGLLGAEFGREDEIRVSFQGISTKRVYTSKMDRVENDIYDMRSCSKRGKEFNHRQKRKPRHVTIRGGHVTAKIYFGETGYPHFMGITVEPRTLR